MIMIFSLAECILQVMTDLKNTFVYQPTLDTLELKKDKGTDYVLKWKSNRVYNSKLKSLYIAFSHSIELSG